MLVVHLEPDDAHYVLNILQRAGYQDAESLRAQAALAAAIAGASIAHNPHADFGQHDGLTAATDAEAMHGREA